MANSLLRLSVRWLKRILTDMTHEEFKVVWLPLSGTFYRAAWSVLGNEADARDAVQDAYVRLWNSRDKLDDVRNPSSFGVAMVKNISLDMMRRKAVRQGPDVEDAAKDTPSGQDADQPAISKETAESLYRAMDLLSRQDRELVRLRFFEDMEYDDISRRTGLNPVNVRVRISRARQKIKQLMRTL